MLSSSRAPAGHGPEAGSFLGAVGNDDAEELRRRSRPRSFERGQTLFHENQISDSVILLESGRVKVTVVEGSTETVLGIRGPGDLIGELSAIDDQPRSATVTAIEPVEALVLPASEFRSFLADHPGVALFMLRTMSRRLRESSRREVEFAAYDTVGRVSARLAELCDRYGEGADEGIAIGLPISQDELAGMTGASVEATKRALHTLRACGWIRTERRRIVVLDREALEQRWQ